MADHSFFDGFRAEQARQEAYRNDPVRIEYDELKRNVFNAQNVFSSLLANLKDLHPTREELDALKAIMSKIDAELESLNVIVWGMNRKARQEADRNDLVLEEYEELKQNVYNAQKTLSSLLASLKELYPTREELDALKAGMSKIYAELKSFDRIVWDMNMKADAVDSDEWWDKQRDNDLRKRAKFESSSSSISIVDQTCAEFARKRVSGGA